MKMLSKFEESLEALRKEIKGKKVIRLRNKAGKLETKLVNTVSIKDQLLKKITEGALP